MRKLENLVPPPVLMVVIAVLMWGTVHLVPEVPVGLNVRVAGAALCFLLAGVFGFPAIRAFRQAGTTINPVQIDRATVLVTAGVYGWTRNPMYVGLTLLLLSWAFLLGHAVAFAGPVLFVAWITRFQIVPEERVMANRFGAAYADYRRRVRRWV